MSSLRALAVSCLIAVFSSVVSACRSPGEGGNEPSPAKSSAADVTLKGVDTSALTAREKSEWSRLVSELLAPCPEHPVSLAQCVNEARNCRACTPAAGMLSQLVRRGAPRAQVENAYRARFSPDAVKNIDVGGSPRKGAVSARVLIVEFADFYCPACAAAGPIIDRVIAKYPNDVALVFKHFPLTNIHPNAEKAARAAVAAFRQDRFWDMHRELFQNQLKLDPAFMEQAAKSLGLDMKRFVQDRDAETTADAVARDRKQGEALQLSGTPSIFINGRPFGSSADLAEDLEQWVALELELTGGAPAAKAPEAAPAPPPAASAVPAASGVVPAASTAPAGGVAPAASR
jgi:protein-disulfide isomerase